MEALITELRVLHKSIEPALKAKYEIEKKFCRLKTNIVHGDYVSCGDTRTWIVTEILPDEYLNPAFSGHRVLKGGIRDMEEQLPDRPLTKINHG